MKKIINPVSRRKFLGLLAGGAAAVGAPRLARAAVAGKPLDAARGKPNVIIIFTDDQGYQDVGCFGSPKIKTPRLDRMAAEGMKFTDFYSVGPVCTPSRAGLMTGCYPQRVGLGSGVLFPRSKTGISAREVTLAELLKGAGYATACVGKWHLGHHAPFLPTRHGFDSYFGIPYSNDMSVDPKMPVAADAVFRQGMTLKRMRTEKVRKGWVPLMRDEKVIEYPCDQATLVPRYTAEAVSFIRANKDRPFFLYLPHTFPHVPLYASAKFRGTSARGLYGDVIEEIDWSTGRILDTLAGLGIDKKTLVIFTSDNGPWLIKGKHGGSALPLRAGKGTTFEGGMREPCIMRWPGRIPAGSICRELAATIDLLPTLAKLAGAADKVPTDRVIDGRDIWGLMAGEPGAKTPHEAFFYFKNNTLEAVRSGKWKLHRPHKTRRYAKKGQRNPVLPMSLFDLRADISEKHNVAEKHPDVVRRLEQMMKKFEAHMKNTCRPVGRL